MKALIALACISIIAVATYYFWGESQRAQERQRRAEFQTYRQECLDLLNTRRAWTDEHATRISWCMVKGAVTEADTKRALDALR